MLISKIISERLKNLRKEMRLTQDQFGAKINVNGRQLARYETGKFNPPITVLKNVADFCEISIDYLVYGYDKKLVKRTNIDDLELLDFLRRIDKLNKLKREKLKWAIKGLLEVEEKE